MNKILNENLIQCPGPAHLQFQHWERIQLKPGEKLAKFTGNDLFPGRGISPWWAKVAPGPKGDPGVDAVLASARKSGRPLVEFLRDAYAVMFEWNTLSTPQNAFVRMQLVSLTKPVFAFHGPAKQVAGKTPPLAYPQKDQQHFPGGAFQLFIPNLTGEYIIGTGVSLLG